MHFLKIHVFRRKNLILMYTTGSVSWDENLQHMVNVTLCHKESSSLYPTLILPEKEQVWWICPRDLKTFPGNHQLIPKHSNYVTFGKNPKRFFKQSDTDWWDLVKKKDKEEEKEEKDWRQREVRFCLLS